MRKILQGAADGLAYLHSQDPPAIHGNIHPNNVLINAEGEAVLCDFGIGRLRHAVHDSSFTIRASGKWRYMAPELFTETGALRPTEASDIYALSMTFLTIVTGRPPFSEHGSYFGHSSASHKGIRPPKPEEMIALTKNQADSLWVLLTSMWDDDPSARPRGTFVYDYLKRRLQSDRVGMPVDSTGTVKLKSRTRTMSVMTASTAQQLPFDDRAVPAKPPGNLHRAKNRPRVFSVPSTPRLE